MDLFMTLDQERSRVKVEESRYIENSRLNYPNEESKILRGNEAVIVVKTGTRGRLVETSTSNLFGYDEYLRCKLFIQLSPELTEGAIGDKELSFVQVLGRFEQEAETKLFLYEEGSLVVDSTTSRHIYLSLDATFRNNSDHILAIDGVIKIKKR